MGKRGVAVWMMAMGAMMAVGTAAARADTVAPGAAASGRLIAGKGVVAATTAATARAAAAQPGAIRAGQRSAQGGSVAGQTAATAATPVPNAGANAGANSNGNGNVGTNGNAGANAGSNINANAVRAGLASNATVLVYVDGVATNAVPPSSAAMDDIGHSGIVSHPATSKKKSKPSSLHLSTSTPLPLSTGD